MQYSSSRRCGAILLQAAVELVGQRELHQSLLHGGGEIQGPEALAIGKAELFLQVSAIQFLCTKRLQ